MLIRKMWDANQILSLENFHQIFDTPTWYGPNNGALILRIFFNFRFNLVETI